jgi:hypothetical protein
VTELEQLAWIHWHPSGDSPGPCARSLWPQRHRQTNARDGWETSAFGDHAMMPAQDRARHDQSRPRSICGNLRTSAANTARRSALAGLRVRSAQNGNIVTQHQESTSFDADERPSNNKSSRCRAHRLSSSVLPEPRSATGATHRRSPTSVTGPTHPQGRPWIIPGGKSG